ncbi:MAG: gluconate 2-dehydrogenase subunit 3 family protein [Myxococcota bacterium]
MLVAGVLAGLAAVFAGWRLGRYPRTVPGRFRVLAPREVAFLAAAGDALYPPGGVLPPSGSEARIPEYVDRYLAEVPGRMRLLMRLLFALVEQATIVFRAPGRGGRRRFSSLRPEQRVAALEGWQRSRFFPRRLVFTSLRAILTMGYFAHPPVLRPLGLAPYAISTPVCDADLLYPPVGSRPEAIRYGPEDRTPPSDGTPLALDGPLHPDYAEESP